MRILPVVLGLLLLPLSAQAGARPYLINSDVPQVPEGDVEIETWIDNIRTPSSMDGANMWRWWIGPRWAPFENVEVAAFTIVSQDAAEQDAAAVLWAEQLALKWRFYSHKIAGSFTLQLCSRIAIYNELAHQISPQLLWATRLGRFGLAAQVGYAAGFGGPSPDDNYHFISWSAAASVAAIKGQITPPLQFGIEAFGEAMLAGNNDLTGLPGSTVNLGPTVALAKGRLWMSAGVLFGLTETSPFAFVRGIIGVAL